MSVDNIKNLNKFSNDPASTNVLDRIRKVIRTVLVNDVIKFPSFGKVSGVSKEYLMRIMVEDVAMKYDTDMLLRFFDQKKYLDFYDKQCAQYHDDMRRCYNRLKTLEVENLQIFSEFDVEAIKADERMTMEVIPVVGYFGKFMFRHEDIYEYDLSVLERIVIGQVLCANSEDVLRMNISIEEVQKLREKFTVYIPALFIRHCPIDLPSVIVPGIMSKIEDIDKKKEEARQEQKRYFDMRKNSIEDERMVMINENVIVATEIEVTEDDSFDNDLLRGQNYAEKCEEIVFFSSDGIVARKKENLFSQHFDKYDVKYCKDVFTLLFYDYDIKSRIVLSRVSKEWYEGISRVKNKQKMSFSYLPVGNRDVWMDSIINYFRIKGYIFRLNPFLYFIMSYVGKCKQNVFEFSEFLITYGKKDMPTGTILLLTILFLDSKFDPNGLDCPLKEIYERLDRRTKCYLRKFIDYGNVLCSGYAFKFRRRPSSFDGVSLRPKHNCNSWKWTGFEEVPYVRLLYDIQRFFKDLEDFV